MTKDQSYSFSVKRNLIDIKRKTDTDSRDISIT